MKVLTEIYNYLVLRYIMSGGTDREGGEKTAIYLQICSYQKRNKLLMTIRALDSGARMVVFFLGNVFVLFPLSSGSL